MWTVILAYSRSTNYFYAYYVLRTVIAMVTDGSVQFLALAYVVIKLLFMHCNLQMQYCIIIPNKIQYACMLCFMV